MSVIGAKQGKGNYLLSSPVLEGSTEQPGIVAAGSKIIGSIRFVNLPIV
jgi:hypothetical protein